MHFEDDIYLPSLQKRIDNFIAENLPNTKSIVILGEKLLEFIFKNFDYLEENIHEFNEDKLEQCEYCLRALRIVCNYTKLDLNINLILKQSLVKKLYKLLENILAIFDESYNQIDITTRKELNLTALQIAYSLISKIKESDMFDFSLLESCIEDKDIDLSNLHNVVSCYRKYIFKERYSHVVLKGGRGSGKTITIAKFLLLKSFNKRYEKTNILCLRQFQNSINDSVKKELENIIYDSNLSQYFIIQKQNIINITTSVTFIFKGADDLMGSSLRQKALNRDKLKGYTNVAFVWIEEAQSVSEGVLDVLIPTPRIPSIKCRFFYSMNPTMANDPVLKKVANRTDSIVVHKNIFDLPRKYQNKNLLEESKLAKLDANYDHIWLGAPLREVQGQPFLNIIESRNLEDIKGCNRFLFIDPSFKGRDFTAVSICYKGDNFINVEGYCFAKSWNNCVIEIVDLIKKLNVRYCFYEDNSLGDVLMNVFYLEGVNISPVTSKKNKIDRIYSIAHLNDSLLFKSGFRHQTFNDQVRYYESEVSKNSSIFNDDAPDSLASCLFQMGY